MKAKDEIRRKKLPNPPQTPGDIILYSGKLCNARYKSPPLTWHGMCVNGVYEPARLMGFFQRRMSGARTHESDETHPVRSDVMDQIRSTRTSIRLQLGVCLLLTITSVFRVVAALCMTSRLSLDLEVLQYSEMDFVLVTIRPSDRSCQSEIHLCACEV